MEMRPEVTEFADDMPVRALVWNIVQYPYHWHNALEIIYVLQGQTTVVISGETHFLNENNIAVINVDEPHSIKKSSGDNKLLIIQIDPAFCDAVNPGYKDSFFYCCSTYHEAEAPEKYDILKSQIAHLVCLLSDDPSKNHPVNVKNCIEEILYHLIDNFDYLRFGPGTLCPGYATSQVYPGGFGRVPDVYVEVGEMIF